MDIDKHGDEMLSVLEGLPHVEYQTSSSSFVNWKQYHKIYNPNLVSSASDFL
ncbi:MAG: hypothetical protein AAF519_17815 [Bacteroidota bacterium]